MSDEADWEARVERRWAALDEEAPDVFLERMAALAAERPAGDARALFELASANDSTGHEAEAARSTGRPWPPG